jgi:hypothetical protein
MMKIFKDSIENFYKWVKGTELVELTEIDITEDPVRPELSLEWRLAHGRKIFGLCYENTIQGIICVAFTNEMPNTVKELELMSELAELKNEKNIAIAYTVWSRKRGAGKEIISKVLKYAADQGIGRVVTLSPLSPMATHFHVKNGARLVSINETTQNFEYKILQKNTRKG